MTNLFICVDPEASQTKIIYQLKLDAVVISGGAAHFLTPEISSEEVKIG